jgi:hypothetical protein
MTAGEYLGLIAAQTTEMFSAFMMRYVNVTNVTGSGGTSYLRFTLLPRGLDFCAGAAEAVEQTIEPAFALVYGLSDIAIVLIGSVWS